MKIVNIDGENLLIFWTTWGLLMELSGKMFHSKPGLHTFETRDSLLLRGYIFGKIIRGGGSNGTPVHYISRKLSTS